jgi:hypothetical protein
MSSSGTPKEPLQPCTNIVSSSCRQHTTTDGSTCHYNKDHGCHHSSSSRHYKWYPNVTAGNSDPHCVLPQVKKMISVGSATALDSSRIRLSFPTTVQSCKSVSFAAYFMSVSAARLHGIRWQDRLKRIWREVVMA